MKKIIALVLALALVLTSVVAIAEAVEAPAAPKGTPNVNSFATMKTKYDEKNHIITITLSKPVDRLLVNWAEKGAEPEELAVGEDLTATALTWGHKYMPGTFQYYATWGWDKYVEETESVVGVDIATSERIYSVKGAKMPGFDDDYCDDDPPQYYVWTKAPKRVIKAEDCLTDGKWDSKKYDKLIAEYYADYSDANKSNIKKGSVVEIKPYIDENGNLVDGSIQFTYKCHTNDINRNFQTVIATPAQTAYMTVQGEWAVYYNRAGKIVGIELFDGQF